MSDEAEVGMCAYCKRDDVEIVASATVTAKHKDDGRVVGAVTLQLCDLCAEEMTQEGFAALSQGALASLTLARDDAG